MDIWKKVFFSISAIFIFIILIQPVLGFFGTTESYFRVGAGQLNCYPIEFNVTIYPGTSEYQNITVWHAGGDYSTYYANHSSNMSSWVTFSHNDTFIPLPPTDNYTTANITPDSWTSEGIYPVNIYSNASNTTFNNCTTLAYVNVSEEVVMDTTVVLDTASKNVNPGDRVYGTITIVKDRGPPGSTNVVLTYWLKDPSGTNFDSTTETIAVTDTWSDIKYRTVPSAGSGGSWTFYVTATYETATDTGIDTFTVTVPSRGPAGPTGGGGGIIPSEEGGLAILEFPTMSIMRQDDIYYTNVLVENLGDTDLSEVHLVVQGVSSEWYTVDPEETNIPGGEKQNFIVKFKIPEDAYIRDYPIQYKVISGSVSDYELGIISLRVKSFAELRIKDIATSRFVEKERGYINVTLINLGTKEFNATVNLDFPGNILADKKTLTKTISRNEEKVFEFEAVSDITGTFLVNLIITYDGSTITKEVLLNVYPPLEIELTYIVTIIIAVIIAPLLLITLLRRRRKKHRSKERLAEIKRILRRK